MKKLFVAFVVSLVPGLAFAAGSSGVRSGLPDLSLEKKYPPGWVEGIQAFDGYKHYPDVVAIDHDSEKHGGKTGFNSFDLGHWNKISSSALKKKFGDYVGAPAQISVSLTVKEPHHKRHLDGSLIIGVNGSFPQGVTFTNLEEANYVASSSGFAGSVAAKGDTPHNSEGTYEQVKFSPGLETMGTLYGLNVFGTQNNPQLAIDMDFLHTEFHPFKLGNLVVDIPDQYNCNAMISMPLTVGSEGSLCGYKVKVRHVRISPLSFPSDLSPKTGGRQHGDVHEGTSR